MISEKIKEIVLASQSPARLDLLKKLGLKVYVKPQDCVEQTTETHPGKIVESLSMLKLQSYLKSKDFNENLCALACDTLLYFEGRMIGKAHSREEAFKQITSLAGKTHQVFSGFCFYFKGQVYSGYDSADVTFTPISSEKVDEYVQSNEWKGAAGSYHLFGKAVDFIEKVDGDINTVIGIPLQKLEALICEVEHEQH